MHPNQTMSIDGSAILVIRVIFSLSSSYLTNYEDLSRLLCNVCQIPPFFPSGGRHACVAQSPLQQRAPWPAVGKVQEPPAASSFRICPSFSRQGHPHLGDGTRWRCKGPAISPQARRFLPVVSGQSSSWGWQTLSSLIAFRLLCLPRSASCPFPLPSNNPDVLSALSQDPLLGEPNLQQLGLFPCP